jgi:prepilin-type N-terminal cleavage/methylation domain-containing protein
MAHKLPRQSGFTLLEMALVVAILAIILGVSAPVYMALSNGSQLDAATGILAQDLYQAQINSRSGAADSQWGVAVNGQDIVLFSGSSYATRNTANDSTYTVPSVVSIGGSSQIVYSKLYGLPVSTGSFTLNDKAKSNNLVVNNKGMLEY